jgi:hypothetical protein
MREALDKLLAEEKKPAEGVGWAGHFAWLKKHGRKIKGKIEDEIRKMDRNRGFR